MMKYNQLQESIIKVPPEILTKVNMYVSSYLYFKIKQYLDRLNLFVSANMSEEEKASIIKDGQNTLAKLQSQYGAKNISAETANNIVNKSIDIPFDVEKFYNELNYKGINPGLIQLMKGRLKLSLLLAQSSNGIGGSKEQHGDYSFLVTVVVGGLGPRPSFLKNASDIMSTTYHELQHIVQSMAIKNINSKERQLQRNPNYSGNDGDMEDYYTSGIEFTPQLGNLIDSVSLELEKSTLKDELNPDKNSAIKDALHKVVGEVQEMRMFLTHLYRKQPEQYKKAMTAVYKKVSPVYDDFKNNGIDYAFTDLPPEELETNIDIMLSVYKLMYKNDAYKVQAFGRTMDQIKALEVGTDTWKIHISKNEVRKDGYYITLESSDPEFEEREKMDSKQVLNLFGILSTITWYDATDIIDDIEFITGERKEINNDSVMDVFKSLQSDAEQMGINFEIINHDSFKMMDKEFKVEKVPDSSEKIDIHYGDKTLYVWSLKQLLIAFQMLIRFYPNYPEEISQILDKDTMYVEFMASLRKL